MLSLYFSFMKNLLFISMRITSLLFAFILFFSLLHVSTIQQYANGNVDNGNICHNDTECKSGTCVNDRCESRQIGANCEYNADCDNETCVESLCRGRTNGSLCEAGSNCNSGLCIIGRYTDAPGFCSDGQPGQWCNNDTDCVSHTCIDGSCTNRQVGAVCIQDSDCDNKRCVQNICRAGNPGDVCEKSGDCISGQCKPTSNGNLCDGAAPSSGGNNSPSSPTNTSLSCASLGPQQCNARSDCFYYAGGKDDGQGSRCVSGSAGADCYDSSKIVSSYCYSNQFCSAGKCYGLAGSWCGDNHGGGNHNEWCVNGLLCQGNYPAGPEYFCTAADSAKKVSQSCSASNCSGCDQIECSLYTNACTLNGSRCVAKPGVAQATPGQYPTAPVNGYCGDENHADANSKVGSPSCSATTAKWDQVTSHNAYCAKNFNENYFYTCDASSSGGSSGASFDCSSIKVTNADGSRNIEGEANCLKNSNYCYMNTGGYATPATCDPINTKGVACFTDSNGNTTYCGKNQVCRSLLTTRYCSDVGTVQPGAGSNSCADSTGKASDALCTSGKCDSTTKTCVGVTPVPSSINTEKEPCANHNGVKAYINSTCGGQLYNDTLGSAGKFCGLAYADRYLCNDNQTIDWAIPAQNAVCNSLLWCPSGSQESHQAPGMCKDGRGNPTDCQIYGQGYVCTEDYPTNVGEPTTYRCTPPGTRYCATAGSAVKPEQGCGSPYVGSGQTCYTNDPKNNPLGNCEPNMNLKCAEDPIVPSSRKCQYDTGGMPKPTPGTPKQSSCDNVNFKAEGCACPTGGGCGYGYGGIQLGCFKSADIPAVPDPQNPNSQFCAGNGTWCIQRAMSVTTSSECTSGAKYTPVPTSAPIDNRWQNDCLDDGNHTCLQASSCAAQGLSPNPATGPGGTNGDRACTYANTNNTSPDAKGFVCCIKSSGATVPTNIGVPPGTGTGTGGSSTGTGGTTGTNSTATCGYSSTQQCQAGSDGLQDNQCITGWTNVGKRECAGNTTCCKMN